MNTLATNTILATKDGRKIGNAIVVRCNGTHCEIKTNYGNKMLLTMEEIEYYFYISDVDSGDIWATRSATHKYRVNN